MIAQARAGAPVSAAAESGLGQLDDASRRRALEFGLGGGLGLALGKAPSVATTSRDVFSDGMIVSFRVLADCGDRPSLAADMVEIGPQGARRLDPLAYAWVGPRRLRKPMIIAAWADEFCRRQATTPALQRLVDLHVADAAIALFAGAVRPKRERSPASMPIAHRPP